MCCRGYILTAPNRFIPGRAETVCVDLVDVEKDMTVELTLYKTRSSYRWTDYDIRDLIDIVIFHIPAGGNAH